MFNIGDRVRIKENADIINAGTRFNSFMRRYLGQEARILKSNSTGTEWKLEGVRFENDRQRINGDGYWWWATEWLEPVEETNIKEITDKDFEDLFE